VNDYIEHGFKAMGTEVHVILVGRDLTKQDVQQVEVSVEYYESIWSRFRPGSELVRINSNPNKPQQVSFETTQLIKKTIEAWRLSDGIYDPTILTNLNSAGYNKTFNALAAKIDAEIELVPTPIDVEIFEELNTVMVPEGVELDLGGIAKGQTADLVTDKMLSRENITGCLLNIGGDIRARGEASDDIGWIIKLNCRGANESKTIRILEGAVCTSSVLKRTWQTQLGQQHHLRNPKNGMNLDSDLVTVSIICAEAIQGEILTKIFLAKGSEQLENLASEYDVTGLAITKDSELILLPGFDKFESKDY